MRSGRRAAALAIAARVRAATTRTASRPIGVHDSRIGSHRPTTEPLSSDTACGRAYRIFRISSRHALRPAFHCRHVDRAASRHGGRARSRLLLGHVERAGSDHQGDPDCKGPTAGQVGCQSSGDGALFSFRLKFDAKGIDYYAVGPTGASHDSPSAKASCTMRFTLDRLGGGWTYYRQAARGRSRPARLGESPFRARPCR